jgi:hypothetical protein
LTSKIDFCLALLRSQNIFSWSKFFVPYQKLIYLLCQFQTFCARTKDDFNKSSFCAGNKLFGGALKFNSIFGLAQSIWISTNHFGSCRRARHLKVRFWHFLTNPNSSTDFKKSYESCFLGPTIFKIPQPN